LRLAHEWERQKIGKTTKLGRQPAAGAGQNLKKKKKTKKPKTPAIKEPAWDKDKKGLQQKGRGGFLPGTQKGEKKKTVSSF